MRGIRQPAGASDWAVLFLFCSWLVLVPLFSYYAFLLRVNRVHPHPPTLPPTTTTTTATATAAAATAATTATTTTPAPIPNSYTAKY